MRCWWADRLYLPQARAARHYLGAAEHRTQRFEGTIGILPNLLNTLYIVGFALLAALPLGVGAAVYLTEYAASRRRFAVVEFATEALAGIPSILYGLVGMLFFCQMLGAKTSLLAGGCTLVIMILPTIIRTPRKALKTVPGATGEGALGWERPGGT